MSSRVASSIALANLHSINSRGRHRIFLWFLNRTIGIRRTALSQSAEDDNCTTNRHVNPLKAWDPSRRLTACSTCATPRLMFGAIHARPELSIQEPRDRFSPANKRVIESYRLSELSQPLRRTSRKRLGRMNIRRR